ncbi:MAG TPA: hypothetical protein VIH59_33530 [Candidatus Tectomicrobia bacterium]|jgi:hypothetical protein
MELEAGSLRSAADALGGAMELVKALVTLGLPTALETNDYLRSLFYGEQRLYNHELVLATYRPVFEKPTVDGYRLDICRSWGIDCEAPAANDFCVLKGYRGASAWAIDHDIGAQRPTKLPATGQICDQSFCDGFAFIECQHPESTNVRETMTAVMDERRDALNDLLMEYLEQIDEHGLFESHELIDTSLLQLIIADRLARGGAIVP